MRVVTRRSFLAAGAAGAGCSWRGGAPSLVQEAPGLAPSYWCTWGAQNYAVDADSVDRALSGGDHATAAGNLTEERLFGAGGWLSAFEGIRQDLFAVFDLGWDVAAGRQFDEQPWQLGSHELASDKFPSCQGTPVERLRRLNELCMRAGWRGAGLWVAAQPFGDGRDGVAVTDAETESQLRDRLRWSRDAGIGYWKVGYGRRANPAYRQLISEMAMESAPSLVVEHVRWGGPLNDEPCPWDAAAATHSGEFRRWGGGRVLQESLQLIELGNVFRTGDVTNHLPAPTTLDRVANLLAASEERPNQPCLINCQDEVYLGAVLGCTLGVLRHPGWIDPRARGYNPRELHRRMDEVKRAVRWQRMAPPFPAGSGKTVLDQERLNDSWVFREGETWAKWVLGQTIRQGAPARVARNMPLPEVQGAGRPYVIASLHPNDSVAVATLPRADAGAGFSYPLANVTLTLEALRPLVGVFGRYRSLTLRTPGLGRAPKLLAQDLAGDTPYDITSRVSVTATEVVIPGEVIHEIGLAAASPGDISDPGMVLRLAL